MPVCLFLSVVSFSYHSLLLNWFYQVYCCLCTYLSHVGNMVHEGGLIPWQFFLKSSSQVWALRGQRELGPDRRCVTGNNYTRKEWSSCESQPPKNMNLGPEAQRATSPIIRSALKSSCRHFMCVFSQVAQAKFIRNVCRYLAVRNMTKKYNKNALLCVRCVFLVFAWCFRPF